MPWGRSYEEYVNMFELKEGDLARRILGCADGPAEFNAVLSKQGERLSQLIQSISLSLPRSKIASMKHMK